MTRILTRLCLPVCFLLSVFPVSAQQDKQPFEFVGASEPLALKEGEESRAQILNNTTGPLKLTIQFANGPAKGDEKLVPALEYEPKVLQVLPAGDGTIVLRVKSNELLEPGAALTAYLIVSDESSDTVKRRVLKFTPLQCSISSKRKDAVALRPPSPSSP